MNDTTISTTDSTPLNNYSESFYHGKPVVTIALEGGLLTIVDAADAPALMRTRWHALRSFRSWYAAAWQWMGNRCQVLLIHRIVTNCPEGYIVHHKNFNSLDNRKENLQVMTKIQHKILHKNNSFFAKFDHK
jgi:hypothetical protein